MGLKKDLLVGGLFILGMGVLLALPGKEMESTLDYDDDDDYYYDDIEDNNGEENYSHGREIPEGYVELYNGNIARLEDVEDLDDLADPSDYYN